MQTFSGRRASQNEFEIMSFISFLKKNNVKRYLEIGARHGDTFHLIMSELGKDAYGVALDFPGGLWGIDSSRNALNDVVKDLNKQGIESRAIFGNSQAEDVVNEVSHMEAFDAILIDGDHTLQGVTKDWDNYRKFSKLIAFHDIVGTGQYEKKFKNPVQVPILWERIKKEYPDQTVEFIDNDSKMGIGVWIRN